MFTKQILQNKGEKEKRIFSHPRFFKVFSILLLLLGAGLTGFFTKGRIPVIFVGDGNISSTVSQNESVEENIFGSLLDKRDTTEDLPVESSIVKNNFINYDERVGLPANADGFIDTYSVNIKSLGDVYSKRITLEDERGAELFILKGVLDNNNSIEVVVGIVVDDNPEILYNWWLLNLVNQSNREKGLEDQYASGEVPLEESYLESIFVKDSMWEYSFYFDPRIITSAEYENVARNVYNDLSPEGVLKDLDQGGSTNVVLMPF